MYIAAIQISINENTPSETYIQKLIFSRFCFKREHVAKVTQK